MASNGVLRAVELTYLAKQAAANPRLTSPHLTCPSPMEFPSATYLSLIIIHTLAVNCSKYPITSLGIVIEFLLRVIMVCEGEVEVERLVCCVLYHLLAERRE